MPKSAPAPRSSAFSPAADSALLFIFAHHQQVAIGRGDGADRRIQSLALKAGADVDQAGRLDRQIPFGAQRDKGFFRRRQKTLVIDGVIDNVDFSAGRPKSSIISRLIISALQITPRRCESWYISRSACIT
jgi:hypothetical protein